MWKAAFKNRGFISEDLEVQIKWHFALNHYAVENSLLCKFVIQGVRTQTPHLAIQAQGRLKSTRYKKVSKKRQLEDSEHRDVRAGVRNR